MGAGAFIERLKGRDSQLQSEQQAIVQAIYKVQGVIVFDLTGHILDANDIFLNLLGYSLEEVRGKHHSIFVEPAYRDSEEYRDFWAHLRAGKFDAKRYKRLAKGGRPVWIQASYNPLFDSDGRPYKIIKFATDVTEQMASQLALDAAVQETQSVISAVLSGNSERRISTSGKTGQLAALAGGVNNLIDNVLGAVDETRAAALSASDGDLERRIDLNGKQGHFRALSESINQLIENMASVVSEIKSHAFTVSASAQDLLRGNANLNEHTESQAANLEETASSMEEMTTSVRQNADHAAAANHEVAVARDEAIAGQAVVAEAIGAMKDINSASSKIADIIGVIDEIAFQTNLLALNAAVEAARAGEQGRGFAVVATEVRSLASRSAVAAKEIKTLIEDSVAKIALGSMLVDRSGETLTSIVAAVKKVTDIVGEITAASGEQARGIELVNSAVSKLDDMTQQNAALVEEGTAAAKSLMDQTRSLSDLMTRYHLKGAEPAGRAAALSHAAPSAQPAQRARATH